MKMVMTMEDNESYWEKTANHKINTPVQSNLNFDIAIIGGGLVGIMCAYYLKDSGKTIAVFEANTLGSQTTGKTTGKITYLHHTIYHFLIKYYGIKKAQLYLDANIEALQEVKDIIEKEQIDCDLEINSAYIYTNDNKKTSIIDKEIKALKCLGLNPMVNQHNLPKEITTIKKSFGMNNQAIFHPLKYLFTIAQRCKEAGVMIYEHSKIDKYEKKNETYLLKCNGHQIISKHVIIATRYPQKNFPQAYFLKLSQSRDHVVSGLSNKVIKDSYLSIDNPIDSFRSCNQHQLYASCDHRVGKYDKDGFKMITKGLKYFDFSEDISFYGAQDTKANRGIPYIGYLDKRKDNQYIACGFNKWGMTLSHVSAKIIRDLILQQDNRYIELFAVDHTNVRASKKEIINLVRYSFKGMIINRIVKSVDNFDDIESGKAKVVRVKGRLKGVYRGYDNKVHVIKPVCKHLRCILEFNYSDCTWDCPCHGSRYTIDGKLVEGPATTSIKDE